MTLELSSTLIAALHAEAEYAHPNECCGILLGRANQITEITSTKNTHPAPATHFEIDPGALISAHKAERAGGPKIQGYYHSHPTGSADPSPTDQEMAARDGKVWAIIGHNKTGRGEIKFWRDDPDGFRSLSYSVVEP